MRPRVRRRRRKRGDGAVHVPADHERHRGAGRLAVHVRLPAPLDRVGVDPAVAAELAALYHERWESEGAFAELKDVVISATFTKTPEPAVFVGLVTRLRRAIAQRRK